MLPHYVAPTYPVLNFIARAGMAVAILLGVATIGAGAWWAQATQQWYVLPVAAIAGLLVTGLLASYVEVVRIIVDTLVPR